MKKKKLSGLRQDIKASIKWGWRLQNYLDGLIKTVEWCVQKVIQEKEKNGER